jgi:hypothetical protein
MIVYDPRAALSGTGSITAAAGAYTTKPTVSGNALFGIAAGYKPGMTTPSGTTKFRFTLGALSFNATTLDWVIISGGKSQYKGTGTVNDGTQQYSYIITALDGNQPGGGGEAGGTDKLRIKIWNTMTNAILYDNQMGSPNSALPTTAIESGDISIRRQ